MSDLGNSAELEAELIKRNREIAKIRDEVLKAERRLEDAQLRNDDLLERVSVLDAEVTTKTKHVVELEHKADGLQKTVVAKEEEIVELTKAHEQKIVEIRKEMEDGKSSKDEVLATQEDLKLQVANLQAEKEQLLEIIEELKRKHQFSQEALEASEHRHREAANRLVESRKAVKDLEDQLREREDSGAQHVQQMHEERSKMTLEIDRISAQLQEHKAVRDDLEGQVRERDTEVHNLRRDFEDLQREAADHKITIRELEVLRDEAVKKHEEHVTQQEDALSAERKRGEEHLQRVMQQAASLDGRLNGQRMMLEETRQALDHSERQEQKLADELAERARELARQEASMRESMDKQADQAARDLSARATQYASELQSEEVCLRRHASSEIDAANRAHAEAQERERRLESRLEVLMSDHEEAKSTHSRSVDLLRNQHQDLRNRLAEAEERGTGHASEGDKLRKDLEAAKAEAERNIMVHRQELERLQQTLEAEGQSRSSSERVLQSQLEEKDTLLEHRDATIQRFEQDLADAKRQIQELESAVQKARDDGEAKVHAMGVRTAQLEGELRIKLERLTEVEGRLEAQRQYLEQVSETLNQAQTDKETLLHAKGSLEAQLKQELSHKDAVTVSLSQAQEESSRRCKELEERILRDRDSHRDAMEEVKKSVAADMQQNSDRLQAVEAELLTARQRCELLMRNKADLQKEVEEHRERHSGLEGNIRSHLGEQERLRLELEQLTNVRVNLEMEVSQLKQDRIGCDARIKDLELEAASMDEQFSSHREDFSIKVRKLDELLNSERESREAAERALAALRQESQDTHLRLETEHRRVGEDLRGQLDSWREKHTELENQLKSHREQLEVHRSRAEDLDNQKREVEAAFRSEGTTFKTTIQRLEVEVSQKERAIEELKAQSAQQQATFNQRITLLERQLEAETVQVRKLQSSKEGVEKDVEGLKQGHSQMKERLGMSAEELFTRQVEFALDKQRLSGALEESRRTLRNSLGVPNQMAAVDSVRISGLEQQLSEERRKSIEQMVALQRAERRCHQLEEGQKRSEEQRLDATQQSREAERRCVGLQEELRKARMRLDQSDVRCDETRERAQMAAAEIGTIRYEANYEAAKLRGALDELRYMLKMQEGVTPTNRGYPLRNPQPRIPSKDSPARQWSQRSISPAPRPTPLEWGHQRSISPSRRR